MSKELPVDRKYELMIRDPLVKNYIEKSMQWFRNCSDETLTREVEQLRKQVREKWNAGIHFPETTKQGITDFWMLVREPYKAVEDARSKCTIINKISEDGLKIKKMIIASFKDNGLIYCPPDKIPIIIDPNILTLYDDRPINEEVWKIVRAEIMKRKDPLEGLHIPDDLVDFMPEDIKEKIKKKKTIKGRDLAVPAKEPKELAEIFRCKPDSFEKYLRWYDLKKDEGFSFSLIALIEFGSKPEYRDQILKDHISRKKKFKPGPQKGESTIREGFNMIHRAIKRKPAPTREDDIPTLKKYNCPEHGDRCSDYPVCAYRERFMADFDNKNKISSLRERLLSPSEDIDRMKNSEISGS